MFNANTIPRSSASLSCPLIGRFGAVFSVSSLQLLLIAGCGGGGGGGGGGGTGSTSALVAANQGVSLQFGTDNRITVVAGVGDAPVQVPVQVGTDDVTGLTIQLLSPRAGVSVDGFSIRVDPSQLSVNAASYSITIAVLSSDGFALGSASGTIDVLVRTQAPETAPLANSQSVPFTSLNVTIQAPAGAFASGSANVKVEKLVDASGATSYRITTSEPSLISLNLQIDSLV